MFFFKPDFFRFIIKVVYIERK